MNHLNSFKKSNQGYMPVLKPNTPKMYLPFCEEVRRKWGKERKGEGERRIGRGGKKREREFPEKRNEN
jgi:hypothetical protein